MVNGLKIKSFSDVITNSSTEVFAKYDDDSFDKFKDIVNSILELTGVEYRFDDLYTIEKNINLDVLECTTLYENYLKENNPERFAEYEKAPWNEQEKFIHNEPREVQIKLAEQYMEDEWTEGYPSVTGFSLHVKDNLTVELAHMATKVAEKLINIGTIFEHTEKYC